MSNLSLSAHARRLAAQLDAADHQPKPSGQTYHVASIGSGFYFAYEQLRNVAEYREHHLLLRSAIQRYLERYVRLDHFEPAAADLVTELTQSGYLKNNTVPLATIEQADAALSGLAGVYLQLREHRVNRDAAADWLYQYASVQIENLLSPDPKGNVLMQFAYEHYFYCIDRSATAVAKIADHAYRIALFCAVQRALFKSDLATSRYYCVSLSLPNLSEQPAEHIIELNRTIDRLYQGPHTNRLFRLINRYGAPLRILRELVMESSSFADLFANRNETLSRVRSLCSQEYAAVRESLGRRILKTIFFIFLTKTLIGVSIEVPYDLFISGAISWQPLIINILFPVAYMIMIGSRISTPSRQNTEVVADYVDRILYEGAGAPVVYKPKKRVTSKALNAAFTTVYVLAFFGSMTLLLWILQKLQFNIVNGIIFFIFLSAVSFLGLRLRTQAHELSLLDERQGIMQAFIDTLTAPFVRVGHWLSDKYAKANIVTAILDTAIEMPIKTSLRLLRQWVSFMRDKQEEL